MRVSRVGNGGVAIIPVLHTNLKVVSNILRGIPDTHVDIINVCHGRRALRPMPCFRGLISGVSRHVTLVISPVLTANNSIVTAVSLLGGTNYDDVGILILITTPRNVTTLRGTRPSIRLCATSVSRKLGRRKCVVPNLNSTNSGVFNAGWEVGVVGTSFGDQLFFRWDTCGAWCEKWCCSTPYCQNR